MTDRVHPSTKPNPAPPTPAPPPPPTAAAPTPAKAQGLYNPTRHPYRTTPTSRSRRKNRQFSCRRCACLACFWSILILIAVILLAAIAAAAFYFLYHPHRPSFSVTALRISAFNLTTTPADDSTRLTARINVTLSARNPNKKITFVYDPMYATVLLPSNSVNLSNGTAGNFTSNPDSVSVIHAAMGVNSQVLDADSVNSLKSDLNGNRGMAMKIVADTMVGVKMEKLKMKKIGIRVKCVGIRGVAPRGKKVIPAAANTSGAKCKVDLRVKIFKWTF